MSALLDVADLRIDIAMASGTLHAVRGIDLSLEPGETLGVVGETGCGKSLSALALMDLLPRRATRTARRMLFEGENLARASARRIEDLRGNRMAMIFQEPMTSLNPAYTIGNQLIEALTRHRQVGTAAARERAVHLLDKVGIAAAGERLRQYPHQLSGGLRQRVMIAMALMCGPRLLICDEPTTALDVTIQAQILLLLKALQREFGMAMIFITHDLGVVARIADRIAVMYAGEVVELAAAAALFSAPRHPYTQGLLRCLPIPGSGRHGERLGVIPGIVPHLGSQIPGCAFANRCDHATDSCHAAPPPWVQGEHRSRCILAAQATG